MPSKYKAAISDTKLEWNKGGPLPSPVIFWIANVRKRKHIKKLIENAGKNRNKWEYCYKLG